MTELIELRTMRGALQVNQFAGGKEHGVCLQLTQGLGGVIASPDIPGMIQLSKDDIELLLPILHNFEIRDAPVPIVDGTQMIDDCGETWIWFRGGWWTPETLPANAMHLYAREERRRDVAAFRTEYTP